MKRALGPGAIASVVDGSCVCSCATLAGSARCAARAIIPTQMPLSRGHHHPTLSPLGFSQRSPLNSSPVHPHAGRRRQKRRGNLSRNRHKSAPGEASRGKNRRGEARRERQGEARTGKTRCKSPEAPNSNPYRSLVASLGGQGLAWLTGQADLLG